MEQRATMTYLGLTGPMWCILAGFCYGSLNIFAKLGFENGLVVSRFLIMRHGVTMIGSYVWGKLVRKIDFNLGKYERKQVMLLFLRTFLAMISKYMQYAAIAFIPLSMSSTISFTTGPIFAAALAWFAIKEIVNFKELIIILMGILGTIMITMPQWFTWLGLQSDDLNQRYAKDNKKYNHYHLGLILAFCSSFLDVLTMFMVRKIGFNIPKGIVPFVSGVYTTTLMVIYCSFFDPLDFGLFPRLMGLSPQTPEQVPVDQKSLKAIQFGLIGGFFGWLGIDFMAIGVQMSKSALSSYAEQTGIILPFLFDIFYFKR